MPSRREFLWQAAWGVTGLGMLPVARMEYNQPDILRRGPKPNLVFLLCDDLGYGDLGCYGNPVIQTPCLDRLASQGIRLTDCYAPQPVCSPSRAGFLTGRTPYRCRIPDWIPENSPIHLQSTEITAAKLLQQAGYRTLHCGKWHLNGGMETGQPTPGDHGFDHWFATQNNSLPSHQNPKNFFRNGKPVGQLEGYSSTLIVDEAIRELGKLNDHQSFALFVWFHSPHEPVATSEEFMSIYSSIDDETQRIYYGNVTQMDHECGRLLNYIDARPMWRNGTLVYFTSDNGPETLNRYKTANHSHGTPGPLRGMKLHLYEGGIRVPGILRPGKLRAGVVCDVPVNGTDLLPTCCDLAEIKPPSDRVVDGTSLIPICYDEPIHRERPLYWRYDRAISKPKLALRDGDWKVLSSLDFAQVELYNLREDLGEKNDLSAKDSTRCQQMLDVLKSIHEEVNKDPVSKLIPDPRDQK